MLKHNPSNERIKRKYFEFRAHADCKDAKTIEAFSSALLRFEAYTRFKDFATFNMNQAIGFKENLAEQMNARTGAPLALATQHAVLNIVQSFFCWLALEAGFKSKIRMSDTAYFNMTNKDARAAKSSGAPDFPSLEQIRRAVLAMPFTTDVEKRDRALMAFVILTGIRDKALVSLQLKHVDLERGRVIQDPKQVDTKASKRIETFFFPVGPDFLAIITEWVGYLKQEKFYGPTDALFPKTLNGQDENNCFKAAGLSREHWQNAQPVRKIFRTAFERVGDRYYNPHSFRHTLGHMAQDLGLSLAQAKAWSQNMGHDDLMTTMTSYGHMTDHRQGELMKTIGQNANASVDIEALALAMIRQARQA